MSGGKSPSWVRHANQSLAQVLPNARHRTLEKQTHEVKAKAHAPVLLSFFNSLDEGVSTEARRGPGRKAERREG
jgi:23S rRNA maturation mini-RNase III